jgi:hypothetical protein
MLGPDIPVMEGQRLLAGEGEDMLSMFIEAAEMFTGNPGGLIGTQSREEQLVQDTGDGAILGLSNLRQLFVHMEGNFDRAAVFAGWHRVLLCWLIPW